MNISIQDWASISEVVAGVAVVFSLIYLAVQLRQNTASLRVSAYQQWMALHHQTFASLLNEDTAKLVMDGCLDSRNLSEDNFMVFIVWAREYFYMQHAQFHLYKKGAIEKEIWEGNLNDLVGTLRFPGVRQWWDSGVKDHFTQEFVDVVENAESGATMVLWTKEAGFHKSPHHVSTRAL